MKDHITYILDTNWYFRHERILRGYWAWSVLTRNLRHIIHGAFHLVDAWVPFQLLNQNLWRRPWVSAFFLSTPRSYARFSNWKKKKIGIASFRGWLNLLGIQFHVRVCAYVCWEYLWEEGVIWCLLA